jgi:arylsulfatase A-like enzyme
MHGFNPIKPSMRTLMVLNGPGVRSGQRLRDVRLIDFAPTLAELLGIPIPKNATGRVLHEVFADPREQQPPPSHSLQPSTGHGS